MRHLLSSPWCWSQCWLFLSAVLLHLGVPEVNKKWENTNCRPALAYFDKTLPASPLSKGVLSNKVSPIFGFFQPMFQVMIIKCIKNQVHQRRTIYWQSRSPDERWISYWKDKWIKPFENCSSYAAWFLKEPAVFFHQEDNQSAWTNMFS